jgi:hypothetical protein
MHSTIKIYFSHPQIILNLQLNQHIYPILTKGSLFQTSLCLFHMNSYIKLILMGNILVNMHLYQYIRSCISMTLQSFHLSKDILYDQLLFLAKEMLMRLHLSMVLVYLFRKDIMDLYVQLKYKMEYLILYIL